MTVAKCQQLNLSNLGYATEEEGLAALIATVDDDKSGQLYFDEFCVLIDLVICQNSLHLIELITLKLD
jgi:Ca2+-binding EF-hand superfamily protein